MTQSCDICRGDRYQRRGRGDQGQQGTKDWPEAQRRQCKISPQTYHYSYFDFVICRQVLKICIKHFWIDCSWVLFCGRCQGLSSQSGPGCWQVSSSCRCRCNSYSKSGSRSRDLHFNTTPEEAAGWTEETSFKRFILKVGWKSLTPSKW